MVKFHSSLLLFFCFLFTSCVEVKTFVTGDKPAVILEVDNTDPDAQAFFTAALITDATQKLAVNQLVVSLKAASLWTKFVALYPMVGGTAFSHKFNLRDPQDTDAAFRLNFVGGWTHSSTGATADGINGYADTFVIPANHMQLNSSHLAYYARDAVAVGYYIAAYNGAQDMELGTGLSGVSNGEVAAALTPAAGLKMVNRRLATEFESVVNGAVFETLVVNSNSLIGVSLYIASINGWASWFNTECALASIGAGMTAGELATFYTIVQTYQTSLSRQM